MTEVNAPGETEAQRPPGRGSRVFEVFNPEYSVGVACALSGEIVGIHLGAEVWENDDAWLAAEILRVARLAHMKSQVGRRASLLERGALPHVADARGLPTESDYRLREKLEFGDGH
ncbi:hypothetical protein [Nocardia jinanensis]|uniref:Uncharacterized protein n=1 Tax=Nocardia jinanensis TaxID=382504 RepID=A0A917VPD1_9NOCA|nr:hypothetical protein [Nocardia jinanensis]GGL05490.1 hypothetical protein GCM10011588_19990 [Nocardia jinanensis]